MITQLISIVAMVFTFHGYSEQPRTVRDYVQPRVSYTNLGVAYTALMPAHVEQWAEYLDASEAQEKFMQVQYIEFVQRHNSLLDREAPRLLEASAEVRIRYNEEGGRTASHTQRLESLCRTSERLRQQLEQVEQQFIDSIEPVLSEQQAERLPALRHQASRRQLRTRQTTMRWVDFELRPIWDQVEHLAAPDDRASVAALLLNYESALTAHLRRMVEAHCTLPVRISQLLVDFHAGALSPEDYQAGYDRVRAQYARTLQAISRLNRNTARQLAELIDEDVAVKFMDRTRVVVFPELYPDRGAIHDIFDGVIRDADLDEASRENVAAMREEYVSHHERVNARLEELCVKWGEQAALGRHGYQTQFLPEALEPLLQQRREISQQWLERLVTAVGHDVVEAQQFGAETELLLENSDAD